jgi:putative membrane protein
VTDQSFVQQAAIEGLAEVQLGKLATDHAASPDVKQFGQQMIKDHEHVQQALMVVAKQKGLSVPTALDRTHQKTAHRLAKLRGAAFDRAYLQQMVKAHEADVRLFSAEAREGQDPDLKQFAADTLLTLEKHLTLGRKLAQHHP